MHPSQDAGSVFLNIVVPHILVQSLGPPGIPGINPTLSLAHPTGKVDAGIRTHLDHVGTSLVFHSLLSAYGPRKCAVGFGGTPQGLRCPTAPPTDVHKALKRPQRGYHTGEEDKPNAMQSPRLLPQRLGQR